MAAEYKWETWFITHQDLMCHRLSPRVEVRTNIKTGLIRLFKDDIEIDRIDGSEMLMSEYERYIANIAIEADKIINH